MGTDPARDGGREFPFFFAWFLLYHHHQWLHLLVYLDGLVVSPSISLSLLVYILEGERRKGGSSRAFGNEMQNANANEIHAGLLSCPHLSSFPLKITHILELWCESRHELLSSSATFPSHLSLLANHWKSPFQHMYMPLRFSTSVPNHCLRPSPCVYSLLQHSPRHRVLGIVLLS
jgi:hypothetical protein